jgi:hypothetical protein
MIVLPLYLTNENMTDDKMLLVFWLPILLSAFVTLVYVLSQ